jgi:3-oxoacyl-[acyl-carrier-protein] synthase II
MKAYIESIHTVSPQLPAINGTVFENINCPEIPQFRAIEPKYSDVLPNTGDLRRMSKLVKMSMYASQKCLLQHDIQEVDAITVGCAMGGSELSEKFLTNLIELKENQLSPTPFIMSLPNTIGGQIALGLKCYGYNMTYSHRGFSFESALADGLLLMDENEETNKILVGGTDELSDMHYDLMNKAGYSKDKHEPVETAQTKGFVLGEGSTFMLLSKQKTDKSLAEIKGIKMLYRPQDSDYLTQQVGEFLAKNNLQISEIQLVVSGNSGDFVQDEKINATNKNLFEHIPKVYFKDYCGEYFTASAFAVWMAVRHLNAYETTPDVAFSFPKPKNILIINHYRDTNYSLILVSQP